MGIMGVMGVMGSVGGADTKKPVKCGGISPGFFADCMTTGRDYFAAGAEGVALRPSLVRTVGVTSTTSAAVKAATPAGRIMV